MEGGPHHIREEIDPRPSPPADAARHRAAPRRHGGRLAAQPPPPAILRGSTGSSRVSSGPRRKAMRPPLGSWIGRSSSAASRPLRRAMSALMCCESKPKCPRPWWGLASPGRRRSPVRAPDRRIPSLHRCGEPVVTRWIRSPTSCATCLRISTARGSMGRSDATESMLDVLPTYPLRDFEIARVERCHLLVVVKGEDEVGPSRA